MEDKFKEVVKTEDVPNVGNVLKVIKGLDICTDFNLNIVNRGYELIAWIKKTENEFEEISYTDLSLIEQVNELRIKVMGIRLYKDTGKACIRYIFCIFFCLI